MFPDLYVPQYLCSPVSMFPGSMFPHPYVPRSYVSRSLCSPIPMFPSTYVPQLVYLCSPGTYLPQLIIINIFFFGGGGVLEQFVDKIGFLFQDCRHCHFRRFILFTFRQKEVCNITFPMTSRMRTLFLTSFLSPAPRSWGGSGPMSSGCPAVRPSVCLYAF